jgi:hypothetical protein
MALDYSRTASSVIEICRKNGKRWHVLKKVAAPGNLSA